MMSVFFNFHTQQYTTEAQETSVTENITEYPSWFQITLKSGSLYSLKIIIYYNTTLKHKHEESYILCWVQIALKSRIPLFLNTL
jgi:hypothetical protein